jgi:hypothetical protein
MFKKLLYNTKLQNLVLFLVVYYMLDFIYIRDIATIYNYEGFEYFPSTEKYILGQTMVWLIALALSIYRMSPFIYAVAATFFITLVMPNVIMWQYMDTNIGISLSCIFFIFCICTFGELKVVVKIPQVKENNQARLLMISTFIMFIPFFFTFGFSFNYNIFLLGDDVYDVRLEAREKFNTYTGYTFNWLSNILVPVGLVYSLLYKKKLHIAFYILAFLYLFLFNAAKGTLFFIFVVILFYFGNFFVKIRSYLLLTLAILLFAAYETNIFLIGTFVNRPFFGPALLCHYYFEFFDGRSINLSSSIMRYFIKYPFEYLPPNIIGQVYFGKPEMNANSGIPSDGFMNFGYLGVGIFSVVEALIIAYIRTLNIDHRFFGVTFIVTSVLISSELFTSVLTHGIFIFLLFGTLFLRNSASNQPQIKK